MAALAWSKYVHHSSQDDDEAHPNRRELSWPDRGWLPGQREAEVDDRLTECDEDEQPVPLHEVVVVVVDQLVPPTEERHHAEIDQCGDAPQQFPRAFRQRGSNSDHWSDEERTETQ